MAREEVKETERLNPARRQDSPEEAHEAEPSRPESSDEQGRGGHQDQALNPLKSGGIPE